MKNVVIATSILSIIGLAAYVYHRGEIEVSTTSKTTNFSLGFPRAYKVKDVFSDDEESSFVKAKLRLR